MDVVMLEGHEEQQREALRGLLGPRLLLAALGCGRLGNLGPYQILARYRRLPTLKIRVDMLSYA
jgi:hypothetical protein